MNLTKKLEELNTEVVTVIGQLLETKGTKAQHSDKKVLKITDEEFCINLENRRYLIELNETELIDNEGYSYSLSVLNLEQLCEIVDSFNK